MVINILISDPQILINKPKGYSSNTFGCVMEIEENEHSVPGQLIVNVVLNVYCIS